MIFRDYYRILELDTNKVNMNQIKAAYRELAKKYHPDVNIGNKKAEERFKDINEAYRVLTNSSTKRKYDRMWISRIGSKRRGSKPAEKNEKEDTETIFSEFFNMFFGNAEETQEEKEMLNKRKKIPAKGENIETEINISIEDGFYGLEKKISLRTVERKNENFHSKNSFRYQKWRKNKVNRTGKRRTKWGKQWRLVY